MKRGGAVYILTNERHTVLYTGVTSDLKKRLYEHVNGIHSGSFTSIYKTHKLVYYEGFHNIEQAIAREKQIKGGSRKKKLELISTFNPNWNNLSEEINNW